MEKSKSVLMECPNPTPLEKRMLKTLTDCPNCSIDELSNVATEIGKTMGVECQENFMSKVFFKLHACRA